MSDLRHEPLRRSLQRCKSRTRAAIRPFLPREAIRMDDEPAPKSGEVRKQTAQIRRSVEAVEQVAVSLTTDADRRTVLATDRTYLASERTYAAWVRTALAALASGI